MKKCFIAFMASAVFCLMSAGSVKDELQPILSDSSTDLAVYLDCDTVLDINGYSVHIINVEGENIFSGLRLFPDYLKQSADKELLESIESNLYLLTGNISEEKYNPVKILSGKISDFRNVGIDTPCNVTTHDSKEMVVEWNLNGKRLKVSLPVAYDTAKQGSRSEIENRFISRLKSGKGVKREVPKVNTEILEPYGDNIYLLPGESYLKKGIITRNIYLDTETLEPVWSRELPLESVANLFIFPSAGYEEADVELKILKHEYGENETVTVPLNTLLAVAEADGCVPYWGVEKLSDGVLEGALFLLNKSQGYDHVIRMQFNVNSLFDGNGKITATASLYIPANNVQNLFAPDLKKTNKEN